MVERPVGPQDFLATIYQHLGIDYEKMTLPDFMGTPGVYRKRRKADSGTDCRMNR